ncbi:MAG: zinc ribbon domain-containing protein [Armatimonadota bacterium]|nr:zinc ribbon domain-containing protein [Armatimonadota bacterium]MDR7402781.1 zinc ribbon domain-containing protein [Armatimonadota bacterium]MDR7404015.1 zinc ribbon domain-containing protein [Armatimonadota bacterium]MDR7437032.1 zinc ribbon domain-containing protein [Armatimonadota bacterium]MDR7472897.1 zinc ribbon domain-containing protein [Armatimonadota bacterium]
MPLYEYRCAHCNHHFEVYHAVGETPGPCPLCGGPARRVFSSVGLIFKGSGFHATDYRKPSASSNGEGTPSPRTESSSKTSS